MYTSFLGAIWNERDVVFRTLQLIFNPLPKNAILWYIMLSNKSTPSRPQKCCAIDPLYFLKLLFHEGKNIIVWPLLNRLLKGCTKKLTVVVLRILYPFIKATLFNPLRYQQTQRHLCIRGKINPYMAYYNHHLSFHMG